MKYFRVCKFEKLQHYKNRTPPWIKLYRDILNDYEFSVLPDHQKAHLIQIWILASQMENRVPADGNWLTRRINASVPVDVESLLETKFLELIESSKSNGLERDAIDSLSSRYQSAMPEKETEEETEIYLYQGNSTRTIE